MEWAETGNYFEAVIQNVKDNAFDVLYIDSVYGKRCYENNVPPNRIKHKQTAEPVDYEIAQTVVEHFQQVKSNFF